MNLPKIVRAMKQKIQAAPDRLALNILIWLEREPAQDRVLLSPLPGESRGPNHNERSKGGRRLSGKETAA